MTAGRREHASGDPSGIHLQAVTKSITFLSYQQLYLFSKDRGALVQSMESPLPVHQSPPASEMAHDISCAAGPPAGAFQSRCMRTERSGMLLAGVASKSFLGICRT